jgi:hypothetical protein
MSKSPTGITPQIFTRALELYQSVGGNTHVQLGDMTLNEYELLGSCIERAKGEADG